MAYGWFGKRTSDEFKATAGRMAGVGGLHPVGWFVGGMGPGEPAESGGQSALVGGWVREMS
jgi:hypothetical protein